MGLLKKRRKYFFSFQRRKGKIWRRRRRRRRRRKEKTLKGNVDECFNCRTVSNGIWMRAQRIMLINRLRKIRQKKCLPSTIQIKKRKKSHSINANTERFVLATLLQLSKSRRQRSPLDLHTLHTYLAGFCFSRQFAMICTVVFLSRSLPLATIKLFRAWTDVERFSKSYLWASNNSSVCFHRNFSVARNAMNCWYLISFRFNRVETAMWPICTCKQMKSEKLCSKPLFRRVSSQFGAQLWSMSFC